MERGCLFPLDQSVIAVTGCTRGIGRALVGALGGAGAAVVVHGRDSAALSEVADEVSEAGARGVAQVVGDLADPGLGGRLLEVACKRFGGLDALVLNASVLGPMMPLSETPPDELSRVLKLAVEAQLRLYQAVVSHLRGRPRGVVLWMSSGLGRMGLARYGAYCAAKHALEGLMKVAAEEDAPHGLVHVAMAPGMVQTDMLREAMLGEDISGYETPERTALGLRRFLEVVGSTHGGASLDIDPWLPA